MVHDAHGWWLREAGGAAPVAPAAGELDADVVVIGGGYAGMWTAWNLLGRGARVVLLEAHVCGHGPSGRNGGFCETLWSNLPSLRERFGDERALAACEASSESVRAIGDWCEAEGVDAWFHLGGFVETSTSEAQDPVIDEILASAQLAPGKVVPLDADAVRARCDSPRFRKGLFVPDDATVQPARLALGLRRRLLEQGARIHERSRVRALTTHADGVVAETGAARVRAGAAVLTINAATRGVRPLRSRLSVTSSHIVLTEPVPEVLDKIGWTGGESITDGRTFLHYFRTTRDGRIAFGTGAMQPGLARSIGPAFDWHRPFVAEVARQFRALFPTFADIPLEAGWGGPIDVSGAHLPFVGRSFGGTVHHAAGFTGNGVGPCRLVGQILARRVLGMEDELTRLPIVDFEPKRFPPEPLRSTGALLVNSAVLRLDRAEDADCAADPLTGLVARLPRRLGYHLGP